MRGKIRIVPILLMLFLPPLLMADMGPKPSAMFEIEYAIEPIPELTDYALFECMDAACQETYLLEEMGPQHFDCTQYECSSMAYGYADTMKIALTFSDGLTRTSNSFGKKHFNAEYRITVRADDLVVKEIGGSGNPFSNFLIVVVSTVCLIGILVIVGIVLIVRTIRKNRRAAEETIQAN